MLVWHPRWQALPLRPPLRDTWSAVVKKSISMVIQARAIIMRLLLLHQCVFLLSDVYVIHHSNNWGDGCVAADKARKVTKLKHVNKESLSEQGNRRHGKNSRRAEYLQTLRWSFRVTDSQCDWQTVWRTPWGDHKTALELISTEHYIWRAGYSQQSFSSHSAPYSHCILFRLSSGGYFFTLLSPFSCACTDLFHLLFTGPNRSTIQLENWDATNCGLPFVSSTSCRKSKVKF